MRPGTVVVDVAVDQGGCIETCKPTTHDDPVYVVDGVLHYCGQHARSGSIYLYHCPYQCNPALCASIGQQRLEKACETTSN